MDMRVEKNGIPEQRAVIAIIPGDRLELPDPLGYRIVCLSGSITAYCSERDTERSIRRGENFVVQCRGRLTIVAHSLALVQLINSPANRLGLGRMPNSHLDFDHVAV